MNYCPECEVEEMKRLLTFLYGFNTDWYGHLRYYRCEECGEHFVQRDNDELELAIVPAGDS